MPSISDARVVIAGYLTKHQLAEEFRVHHRTIERWIDQPDGLPFTKIGGRTLFNVESVRAWMKGREQQRNPSRARVA